MDGVEIKWQRGTINDCFIERSVVTAMARCIDLSAYRTVQVARRYRL